MHVIHVLIVEYFIFFFGKGYKDPEEMGPLLEELMNSLVEMLVDVPVM